MTEHATQGRYARMFAFWALVLLVAYGCFHGGGLADLLDRWMGDSNRTFVDPFPILKTLKTSTCIALGVLVAFAFVAFRTLNRPRIASTLADAEVELAKVTWPDWAEARQGTIAVIAMVIILFLYLTVVDLALIKVMLMLMGGGVA